jgi:hypothetical protein
MTGAVLERPTWHFEPIADQPASGRFARPSADGRGATLEERLNSALHATRTNGSTECLLCDGTMTREAGSTHGGGPAVARCTGCGSHLS